MLEPYLSLSPKLNDVPKESFIFLWEEIIVKWRVRKESYTKRNLKIIFKIFKYVIIIVIKWISKIEFGNGFVVRNCPINWWAATTKTENVQVKGIIQTQNMRTIQENHFTTFNIMEHPVCKYIVQIVGEKMLVTFSTQVKMNCCMALNCETKESGFCAQCCVWHVAKSEEVTTLCLSTLHSYSWLWWATEGMDQFTQWAYLC